MIEYKLIMFKNPVIVTNQDLTEDFPYIVAERLITGEWWLMTAHNINDIDKKNQLRVIGGVPGLPKIDFSKLYQEGDSLFSFTIEDIKKAVDLAVGLNYTKQAIVNIISQKTFNCEFEAKGETLRLTKLY